MKLLDLWSNDPYLDFPLLSGIAMREHKEAKEKYIYIQDTFFTNRKNGIKMEHFVIERLRIMVCPFVC